MYAGSCYRLVDDAANWTVAQAVCECLGFHLVTISSAGENQFVTDLVNGVRAGTDGFLNSFNKTEAAVFSCRLCFLRAFPFFRLCTRWHFVFFLVNSTTYFLQMHAYMIGRRKRFNGLTHTTRLIPKIFIFTPINNILEVYYYVHNENANA